MQNSSNLNEKSLIRSVVLFAYNEEDTISASIEAVRLAGLELDDVVTVLINGCTDRTLSIVEAEAKRDSRIRPVKIALGDKANAWDVYTHRYADPKADLHIFIDGDVRVSAGAFFHLDQAMKAHPEALAFSTIPRGGRQAERWGQRIMTHHGMPGNFYAIPERILRRMKDKLWLPVGFMGDDTLLRWLFLRDLDPTAEPELQRIRPVAHAYFDYSSLERTTLSGLSRLWRRHLGYTRREIQFHVLKKVLISGGLSAMPRRIIEIYDRINPLGDMVSASVGFRGRRLIIPFLAIAMRVGRRSPSVVATAWFDEIGTEI